MKQAKGVNVVIGNNFGIKEFWGVAPADLDRMYSYIVDRYRTMVAKSVPCPKL